MLTGKMGVVTLPAGQLRLELWVSKAPAFQHCRKTIHVSANHTVQAVTSEIKTWYDANMAQVKAGCHADWVADGHPLEFSPKIKDKGDEGYGVTFVYSKGIDGFKLTAYSLASVAAFFAACIIAAAAFVYFAPEKAAAWAAAQ